MSDTPQKDTHAKALQINLDASIYGTFAEIGAGQEVARWFLTVGAASGTVAKTISAYDKTFSDKVYGAGTRYVSRERLAAMLDHEYHLLVERLQATRGSETRFFAFADTVATRNYKGDNEQHGWMGIRFQTDPGGEPSELMLHVNLMDATAQLQQEALGVLGVNLLHALHHERSSARTFLESLWAGLSIERLEIDVLDFAGPAFGQHDPRAWCIELLRRKMAHGIVFSTEGEVTEPSSVLRKRPLLVDRGRFETLEPFHAAMLESAHRALKNEGTKLGRESQSLLEIALHPAVDDDSADDKTVLSRVEKMLTLAPAVVTDLAEGYRLMPYLRRHTTEPIRLVGGVSMIARMLEAQYYGELAGSLLEGMGKLFAQNVKFYVFPMPRDAVIKAIGSADPSGKVRVPESSNLLISSDDLVLAPPLNHLYRYLREAGQVVPIEAIQA
ncbi:MAG TPA: hypothetical protein VH518_10920 [Tepidisphaeraceae bacterium]|jgi:hypothetical protein